MGATVVENMHAGVTTSLPLGRSRLASASRQADDPELTKSAKRFPNMAATRFSNSTVRFPNPASQPSRRHWSTAWISASPYAWKPLGAYQTLRTPGTAGADAAADADPDEVVAGWTTMVLEVCGMEAKRCVGTGSFEEDRLPSPFGIGLPLDDGVCGEGTVRIV